MSAARLSEIEVAGAARGSGAERSWLEPALAWFESRGWTPFDFQLRAWGAYGEGRDGLVHAPTGTGKTYAVWMGPVLEAVAERGHRPFRAAVGGTGGKRKRSETEALRVVWLTPLRALAGDTHKALCAAAEGLGLNWSIELRTGDTPASLRSKQRQRLPTALITTPESLSLLLTYPETAAELAGVRCVIVDEWHELMGTKRGVQTELCLARLRSLAPTMRTWGLSATLGNLDEAMRVLVGNSSSAAGSAREPALVSADTRKEIEVVTLIPDDIDRFPWAGHLGIRLLPAVIKQIEAAATTLVFTNTRSQTEIWFQAMQRYKPELIGQVGLHHGSVDRDIRSRVEDHLRAGSLRCVVCTSSLDLGVDFQPVDQVIQIGSPKGVARLLQRAGRSGHQPGKVSRIVCVPTNALELVEFAAAADAIAARTVEARRPMRLALDVLVQHMVSLAAGCGDAGIDTEAMFEEVRRTHAFAELTREQWGWCLDFVTRGGPALTAYPQYARLVWTNVPDVAMSTVTGSEQPVTATRLKVASAMILRMHRLNVGTITSDPSMTVRVSKSGRGEGSAVGTIEEGFIAKLKVGDVFAFAGRLLRLMKTRGMTAYTMPATRKSGQVASWAGARVPLSAQLAAAVRVKLAEAGRGELRGPAMGAVGPLLEIQERWSRLPRPDELVIEVTQTTGPGGGHHVFVFPLEGRLVHEGLAALLAFRIARLMPRSFTFSCNDYGLELVGPEPIELDEAGWRGVLSPERLGEDFVECLNATELSRRQFRDVSRIAGLIMPTYPGEQRRLRHLQASSEMFFDVLSQFDPQNLLLDQARREVLDRQLEVTRLREALERIAGLRLVIRQTATLTPFSFPLWADSLREQVTSEKWSDRVKRMLAELEEEADRPDDERKKSRGGRRAGWRGPAVRATRPKTGK